MDNDKPNQTPKSSHAIAYDANVRLFRESLKHWNAGEQTIAKLASMGAKSGKSPEEFIEPYTGMTLEEGVKHMEEQKKKPHEPTEQQIKNKEMAEGFSQDVLKILWPDGKWAEDPNRDTIALTLGWKAVNSERPLADICRPYANLSPSQALVKYGKEKELEKAKGRSPEENARHEAAKRIKELLWPNKDNTTDMSQFTAILGAECVKKKITPEQAVEAYEGMSPSEALAHRKDLKKEKASSLERAKSEMEAIKELTEEALGRLSPDADGEYDMKVVLIAEGLAAKAFNEEIEIEDLTAPFEGMEPDDMLAEYNASLEQSQEVVAPSR